jgi:hypothetical protein
VLENSSSGAKAAFDFSSLKNTEDTRPGEIGLPGPDKPKVPISSNRPTPCPVNRVAKSQDRRKITSEISPKKESCTSVKFQVKNRSIECIRVSANNEQSVIVRFDEHLRIAPPHVINKLIKEELVSLADWLAERELIKGAPAENNLLYLLPSLMDEAIAALDHIDGIHQEPYSLLLAASEELQEKLLSVEHKVSKRSGTLTEITDTEANKERIKQVKNNLL